MKKYLKLSWPLLLMICLTPFTPFLDNEAAKFFYTGTGKTGFLENGVTSFFFRFGEMMGFILGAIAIVVYVLSWSSPKWKKWREGALVLILTGVLGCGLIVNAVLKEHWVRPRPKQVIEFGGVHPYRPFYAPKFLAKEEPQKSFPSGHVSAGFYFLSLCLVARRYQKKRLFLCAIFLTLFWGGGLIFSRIAQGGHFVSDALFSVLIMWYIALLFDKCVFTWGRPKLLLQGGRVKSLHTSEKPKTP